MVALALLSAKLAHALQGMHTHIVLDGPARVHNILLPAVLVAQALLQALADVLRLHAVQGREFWGGDGCRRGWLGVLTTGVHNCFGLNSIVLD